MPTPPSCRPPVRMSLGRQGLALSVTTPKDVVVRVDGKNRTATTTGATVADVLSELNVTKDADDRVKPAATTAVTAGLKIAVLRVTATQVKETKAVAAPVTRKSDSSLYKGQTKTLKAGSDGAKIVTYKVVKVDGKVESKKAIATKVTQAPVARSRRRGHQGPSHGHPLRRRQHLRRRHQPRQRGHVGPHRPVRVRRQLVDQHRQRLLRRSAVRRPPRGWPTVATTSPRAPTWPRVRSRSPSRTATTPRPASARGAARTLPDVHS